jgi:hypothetical protein
VLKIDETRAPTGELTSVSLRVDDGVLSLVDEHGTFALPRNALEVVMRRYGTPFDDADARRLTHVASLALGDGRSLHHIRHLAPFDVIARDWLVYEEPDRERVCVLAVEVTRALTHLARAAF